MTLVITRFARRQFSMRQAPEADEAQGPRVVDSSRRKKVGLARLAPSCRPVVREVLLDQAQVTGGDTCACVVLSHDRTSGRGHGGEGSETMNEWLPRAQFSKCCFALPQGTRFNLLCVQACNTVHAAAAVHSLRVKTMF